MRHLTTIVAAVAAFGNERVVDLGVGGEAARTEQAGVSGRSIEALS